MIKVSFIVPIYNAELFLDKCLESIVNQSIRDIEIILINDGSSDKSLEICKKYAENDERIIIINQKNSGVSFARNKGIKVASGKYLAFVDSDDWIDTEFCKNTLDKLENNEYDLIIFNSYEHKGTIINKTIIFDDKTKVINKGESLIPILISPYRFKSNKNVLIGGPIAKLYNRKFMIENNILFNTNIVIHEDDLLNLIFIKKSKKILYINEQLYNIRRNEFSSTRRFMELGRENIQKTIEEYKRVFKLLKLEKDYSEYLNERIVSLLIILNSIYFSNKYNTKKIYIKRNELKNFIIRNNLLDVLYQIDIKNLDKKRRLAVILLKYRLYGGFLILSQINLYIKNLKRKKFE